VPDPEGLLPDVPATFPRPDPVTTERVRRRVLSTLPPGRPRGRSLAISAALVFAACGLGFSAGHWLTPRGTAATSISFDIRPLRTEAFFGSINAFGAVRTQKSGETVLVEALQCGGPEVWQDAGKTETGKSGTWIVGTGATTTTTFRARWKNGGSATVTIRVRPHLNLVALPKGRFLLSVAANDFFDGRRAILERRSGNRWVRVRPVTLHRTNPAGYVPWSGARFDAKLEPGTSVRAVLPKSQVGRCYLAGYSNIVRA
jgi:hypothetical protein